LWLRWRDPWRAPPPASAVESPRPDRESSSLARAFLQLFLGIKILVGVAQQVLLDLAHGVARQVINDEDTFRHLEFGQPSVEGLEHGRLADVGIGMADHHGGDALAEIGMR